MSAYWDLISKQNSSKSIFKSISLMIKLSWGGLCGADDNENVRFLMFVDDFLGKNFWDLLWYPRVIYCLN